MTMDSWELKPARDLGLPAGERLRSLQREGGLVSTATQFAWWSLVRGYMAMWHRLEIHGRENIPDQPPFVLVANHSSHLDALVLASPLSARLRDRIFPIAAGDVFFETPLVTSFAAHMLNALPMWRKKCGRHAMEQLRERLTDDPCAYILFPEGTRSRDGSMNTFKPGLGMLVAETDVPVLPCYLAGCFDALPPDRKWPRRRPITIQIGAPLTFGDVTNNREGWKKIAATVQDRMQRLALIK